MGRPFIKDTLKNWEDVWDMHFKNAQRNQEFKKPGDLKKKKQF